MGVYLTDLADVLRGGGLTVVEVDGWKSRGFKAKTSPDGGLVQLTGGLVHHTGTPDKVKGDYPTLNTILKGRSDVPGPLSQLGLGRSGTWYVCAAGRANHSGAVDDPRYANPRCLGVEAEHPGTGTWPVRQYLSYVTGCAVLSKRYGIRWRGHKEAAVPRGRKVDPIFDMATFRGKVADAAGGNDKEQGDDMFSNEDRAILHRLDYALDQIQLPALTRIDARVAMSLEALGRTLDVDEEEVARLVLRQLTPEKIAAAIPPGIASSVADLLEIKVNGATS